MKQKSRSTFITLLLILIVAISAIKLLVNTNHHLIQDRFFHGLLSPPEVLARDQKKPNTQPAAKDPLGPIPSETTPTEIVKSQEVGSSELLASIEQRELELRRKEQQLREQEQHLLKMQKELENKMQELLAIQKEIQAYRNEREEAKLANVRSLAQIYASMKAKEAAKLLENMDEKLVVTIVSTMKSNEAAEIFAAMDSKKAAKISEALTQR